eukprot:GSMAST32.ASY1.ANO1.179.1 assembled CDS
MSENKDVSLSEGKDADAKLNEEKGDDCRVTVCGQEYPSLMGKDAKARGKYDAIILGTGIQSCLLGLCLAQHKKRVLQVDREKFYGGEGASLALDEFYEKFVAEGGRGFGRAFNYQIDLCPKFIMAQGDLVKLLVHALGVDRVSKYGSYCSIGASYVYKGEGTSGVPSTKTEAMKTPLVGMLQKRALIMFLQQVQTTDVDVAKAGKDKKLPPSMTVAQLYEKHGLDQNTQEFVGHSMALYSNDNYKLKPAIELVERCRLYAASVLQYGSSPYLYPEYGISSLPQNFARYSAVLGESLGGAFMLGESLETKQAGDGICEGIKVGDKGVATAPIIIGEPCYFPKEKLKLTGKIIRAICILNAPIDGTNGADSCQIIIPQTQVAKRGYPARANDVYVTCVGASQYVASKGFYVAIVSTVVETNDPSAEVQIGIDLINGQQERRGRKYIVERFDDIKETYSQKDSTIDDHCYISNSYTAEPHFGDVSTDVLHLFEKVTGKPLDMSISTHGAMDG